MHGAFRKKRKDFLLKIKSILQHSWTALEMHCALAGVVVKAREEHKTSVTPLLMEK